MKEKNFGTPVGTTCVVACVHSSYLRMFGKDIRVDSFNGFNDFTRPVCLAQPDWALDLIFILETFRKGHRVRLFQRVQRLPQTATFRGNIATCAKVSSGEGQRNGTEKDVSRGGKKTLEMSTVKVGTVFFIDLDFQTPSLVCKLYPFAQEMEPTFISALCVKGKNLWNSYCEGWYNLWLRVWPGLGFLARSSLYSRKEEDNDEMMSMSSSKNARLALSLIHI